MSYFVNQMREAIKIAKKAYESGEVPVGCVIVDALTGKIIASSGNRVQEQKLPNAHAEILSIDIACKYIGEKNLNSYDLYVTLEPCFMCLSAISNARLRRVYFGAYNYKFGAVESKTKFFQNQLSCYVPEIYGGIEQVECERLMTSFFKKIRASN